MINHKVFFDQVREHPFGGSLTPSAVTNIEAILTEWERRRLTDLRHLAYMLATVLAECGRNMAPIPEVGRGRGHPYGRIVNGHVYYGRGYVQLTWDYNYKKLGQLTGVDLYNHPDLALQPTIASKILFEGMLKGSFTNKKLSDYFSATKEDWYNARRIINGVDRASEIAGYGKQFYAALIKARTTVPSSTPKETATKTGGWMALLFGAYTAIVNFGYTHPWLTSFGVAAAVILGMAIHTAYNQKKEQNVTKD